MNQPAFPHLAVPPGPQGVRVVAAAMTDLMTGADSGFQLVAAAAAAVGGPLPGDDAAPTPAVVLQTSGSTGTPAAVVLPLSAVLASADLGAAALGAPGYWLTAVPVTGIGGLLTVVRALRAGVQPIGWPGLAGLAAFTPESFTASAEPLLARAAAEGRPAYVSLVPTQVHRLLDSPPACDLVARFTRILVGGSRLSAALRDVATSRGLRLVSTYGATETAGGVVYDGIPLPGVTVTVTDGIIRLGGPTIASGYLCGGDDSLADGTFRTRDLGEWRDGRLTVVGRADEVIKVGGEKVSLPAITAVLLADDRVLDAATLAQESAEWGQLPHCYVVPRDPADAALATDLTEAVIARLGRRHRPHTMAVVSQIPVSAAGKPLLRKDS
jgi:O-succinylbenzoic acid--CoA ligase